MKDIKHVKRDFYSVVSVMPRGWDFGGGGEGWGAQGSIFLTWLCGMEQNEVKRFILWSSRGPWGQVKRSNTIKFQLQSQFQRFFIPNFVCVLTNKR